MKTRRRWLAAGAAWPALAWTGALRAQTNPPVLIGVAEHQHARYPPWRGECVQRRHGRVGLEAGHPLRA